MKFLTFHLFLKPLIVRNYMDRMACKLPDKWYWADVLAMKWGYFVCFPEMFSPHENPIRA